MHVVLERETGGVVHMLIHSWGHPHVKSELSAQCVPETDFRANGKQPKLMFSSQGSVCDSVKADNSQTGTHPTQWRREL